MDSPTRMVPVEQAVPRGSSEGVRAHRGQRDRAPVIEATERTAGAEGEGDTTGCECDACMHKTRIDAHALTNAH